MKTIAVRYEGTVAERCDPDVLDFGNIRPEARVRLASLVEAGNRVLILSASVKYPSAAQRLWRHLIHENVAFTDVWCGEGIPNADVYVDDTAVRLENA